MLVKVTEDTESYKGMLKAGEEVDLNPSVALSLVRQGLAVESNMPSEPMMKTLDLKTVTAPSAGETLETMSSDPREPRTQEDALLASSALESHNRDTSITGAASKREDAARMHLAAEEQQTAKEGAARRSVRDLNEEAKKASEADKK